MAPTDLVEGAVEPSGSEGVASLGGPAAAAGKAPQAAVPAAASLDAAPPAQLQQAAEMQAGQHMQPTEAEPEQDVFDLLQAVVEVAAAAPSGLTPELAAAFVMLPNLDARRVSLWARKASRGCVLRLTSCAFLCLRAPDWKSEKRSTCGHRKALALALAELGFATHTPTACRRPTCAACSSVGSTAPRQCRCAWRCT